MRFRYETHEEKEKRLFTWHTHFTLLPVKQDGVIYWMETVYRRCVDSWVGCDGFRTRIWEYLPVGGDPDK